MPLEREQDKLDRGLALFRVLRGVRQCRDAIITVAQGVGGLVLLQAEAGEGGAGGGVLMVEREGLFEQLHGGRGRLRRIGFLQQLVGLVDDAVLRQR